MAVSTAGAKKNLKDFGEAEFSGLARGLGLPDYRGRQISKWVFSKGASSFEEMTDLPKELRSRLQESHTIEKLVLLSTQRSVDGTRKFLFQTPEGVSMETVLIPDEGRRTLCVSTQSGCRMGCSFCVTGTMGLIAQLPSGDIVDQFLAVVRETGERISHLVLMGMGEPLDNYDNVARAVRALTQPGWVGLSPRRITLSTCGLVPAMVRFKEEFPNVRLAVSLGAPDDERRDKLIPVNRRYPLEKLMAACRELPLRPRERITFEYTVIKEVNDSAADASALCKVVHGIRCKVNLLSYNPSPSLPYQRPDEETVDRFARVLVAKGITVTVRKSRGQDIEAACGLLATGGP